MDVTISQNGEFAGWSCWADEPFEYETVGPFYFRHDAQGPVAAFRAEHKHMNAGGVVHGGCLMSFADFALFAIAHDGIQDTNSYGVTVAFNCEFLAGALKGQRIEARGEKMGGGRSIQFVRGVVTADDIPVLNFSGTIKMRHNKT